MTGEQTEPIEVDCTLRLEWRDDCGQYVAEHVLGSLRLESGSGNGKHLERVQGLLDAGNLITLAVAFVIGLAFAALLNAFVADLITPLLGAIVGKTDFSSLTFSINGSRFLYGAFISALITFVSTAAAVFFFIVKPYESVMARVTKPTEDEVTDEERRHQELLAALRSRS